MGLYVFPWLVKMMIPICIVLPKSDGKCMFSAENIWKYRPDSLTRYERVIDFGVSNGGYGWRLAGFNDLKFNIYGEDGTGEVAKWENLRKERKYPFKAKLVLGKEYVGKIKVAYTGKLGDGEFVEKLKVVEMDVDRENYQIEYQNYICEDGTDECFENIEGLVSLSDKESILSIQKVNE